MANHLKHSVSYETDLDSNHHADALKPPDFSSASIKNYFLTRFTELFPTGESLRAKKHLLNPIPPLRTMNRHQWNFFFVSFWCWSMDAFDYFAVSLNVSNMAESFNVSTKDITWGITLVLMLRTVGLVIFGLLSDRFGRKYPLVLNLILLSVLQIGTGFVKTYKQFLGVRALFGILMGGVFGNVLSTALEDAPVEARGILSGFLQQGYAFGYLLVVVFQRLITDNTEKGWRSLFWFSAGVCVIFIVWRLMLPETNGWKAQRSMEKASAATNFKNQAKGAVKTYWLVCVYLIFLMAGFNFSSHGSQDLYPTLLTKELNYGEDRSTVTNSVANLGAIAGGIFMGHLSDFAGRRLTVIICCILGGAMIYPWAFTRNTGINAGAFFLQFFVQGAWGVVPIHLSELSPAHFRSFICGTSYQLGNLASSASSTIEATIGERFPLYDDKGEKIKDLYNYSKVMAIFMGCVFAYLLLITLFGPENSGASLVASNVDDEYAKALDNEKQSIEHVESVDSDVARKTSQVENIV